MSRPQRSSVSRLAYRLRTERQQLDTGARILFGVSGGMYRTLERIAVVAVLVYLIEIAQANPEWAIAFAAILLIGAEGAERVLMSLGDAYDPRVDTSTDEEAETRNGGR